MALALERRRREWVYISTPTDMDCGECPKSGGKDYLWSEFYPFVWCKKCRDDVIPAHYGVLDGPVSPEICKMIGIYFDAYDVLTRVVVPFDSPLWPNLHLQKEIKEYSPFAS